MEEGVKVMKIMGRIGVITGINSEGNYKSIHIDGTGIEGVILNIDENTVIRNSNGQPLRLEDLSVGMTIQIKHSMAMTMSLPPQTYAYEIIVLNGINK